MDDDREPPFDDEIVSGIIRLLMRIDANVQELLELFSEEENDGEGTDS